jgi:aspartyl-tRNA(Asn)/glutamyl-tRNA(Gln) amidotransferase subunit A
MAWRMAALADSIFLARGGDAPPGRRLAVKDLLDTAGIVTTYGSTIFADNVPLSSAEAVVRLEAKGYVDVGKTNLHEFAYGVTSQNPHFGTVLNPRAPDRIAGGSSGGSAAAVAAGLADVALGTDSGGSIRMPAACCGVVGFKPTFDLVPATGCFPLAPSFDHVGPMAATVAACVEALAALAPTFTPRSVESLEEVRVGVAWIGEADPLVRERVETAAARFPRRATLELPFPETIGPAFMREVADVHRDLYAEYAEDYGSDVAMKVERCLAVTDAEYERAAADRERYRDAMTTALAGVELLLTPTLAFVAPRLPVDEREIRDRMTRFTLPFNALGWPALALPCGGAEDGLPASLQIIGRAGDDALVLAAGELLGSYIAAARTAAS